MTLESFKDKLIAAIPSVPVYHILAAPEEGCPILCWQEMGAGYAFGDDSPVATVVKARIDLLVDDEYSTLPAQVSELLNAMGVWFSYDGIGYNVDREEWNAVWQVQFLGG